MTPAQSALYRFCAELGYNEAPNGTFKRYRGKVVGYTPTDRHNRIVSYMTTIGNMEPETVLYEIERILTFGLDAFS